METAGRLDGTKGARFRSFLLLGLDQNAIGVPFDSLDSLADRLAGEAFPIVHLAVVRGGGHAVAGFVHEDAAGDASLQIVVVEAIGLVAYVATAWDCFCCCCCWWWWWCASSGVSIWQRRDMLRSLRCHHDRIF